MHVFRAGRTSDLQYVVSHWGRPVCAVQVTDTLLLSDLEEAVTVSSCDGVHEFLSRRSDSGQQLQDGFIGFEL